MTSWRRKRKYAKKERNLPPFLTTSCLFHSCLLKMVMVFLGVTYKVIHVILTTSNFYKVAVIVKRLVTVNLPKWQNDSVVIVKSFWWHCFWPLTSALRRSILHFILFLLPRFSNKIQVTTAFKTQSYMCFNPTCAWPKRIFFARGCSKYDWFILSSLLRETKLSTLLDQKSR